MPFQNYKQLTEEVDDLLARAGLQPKIPGWIDLAQREIVRKTRNLQDVIFITSGTLTGGVNTLKLPEGYTSIEVFQIDSNPIKVIRSLALAELKEKQAIQTSANKDSPRWYARIGGEQIEMTPNPVADDAYTLYYKGMYPYLDENSTTSQVLVHAPDLLLYGAAKHSAPFNRDDRGPEWGEIFRDLLKDYRKFLARTDRKTVQVSGYGSQMNDGPSGTYG